VLIGFQDSRATLPDADVLFRHEWTTPRLRQHIRIARVCDIRMTRAHKPASGDLPAGAAIDVKVFVSAKPTEFRLDIIQPISCFKTTTPE
jgi:hypothetical protein